jgi:hypothetical protein
MTKRIYSLDPIQNAELAAQHAFEARAAGVSVDTYWGEDSHREHDGQWGDEFGDLDLDGPLEYRVDLEPAGAPGATITVFIDADDEDHAKERVLALYEGARILSVDPV